MNSSTTKSFRDRFRLLPPEIRRLARKNYKLWTRDPRHGSIQFKKVGRYWSARIGIEYRALAVIKDKGHVLWFWIGHHDEYMKIIR